MKFREACNTLDNGHLCLVLHKLHDSAPICGRSSAFSLVSTAYCTGGKMQHFTYI